MSVPGDPGMAGQPVELLSMDYSKCPTCGQPRKAPTRGALCGHSDSLEVILRAAGRFWAKVSQGPDCWEWTGSHTPAGYGQLRLDGRLSMAHRVSWQMANASAIPTGAVIRHMCDNPRCVNPEHLELGTQSDNMSDRWRRSGRHFAPSD